jgi:hypothetical protein
MGGIIFIVPASLFGQQAQVAKKDTVAAIHQAGDRGVMNNAANNTGPRPINIGLPGGVGGTTVIENGIPVVYTQWPALPTKLWRRDNSIIGFKLNDLANTALNYGDIGFSVATIANTGTPFHMGAITLNTNHFGLLRTALGLSGPLNKKGLMYAVGAYVSYDPGTFNNEAEKFYQDQTHMYKAALSQAYKYGGGSGKIGVFYKYANSKGMLQSYAPYIYERNGKVKEIDGMEIGRTSFFDKTGKVQYKDPYTGKIIEKDAVNDYGTESNTLDIVGNNKYDSGLNLNYTLRYQTMDAGLHIAATGKGRPDLQKAVKYMDDGSDYEGITPYETYKIASKTPIKTYAGLVEIAKKSGKHDWKVALMEQLYDLDGYHGTTTFGLQALEENPRKLIIPGYSDAYGNLPLYNNGIEYYKGKENKLAVNVTDKWDILNSFTLNYGTRLEWKNINGEYAPTDSRNTNGTLNKAKFENIDGSYLSISANVGGVYKMTDKFGLTGDAGFYQTAPTLENYGGAIDPQAKKSTVPTAGIGVFFNHPMVSLVSKATYISRDNNVARIREKHPTDVTYPTAFQVINYDMQSLGWTTDAEFSFGKNFKLHFLMTIQNPVYKGLSGDMSFARNGASEVIPFDFSNNTVTGISKVLLEIDPSYQWNKVKLWSNIRYFSKQFVNQGNTIYYAPRWETFAGLNYAYSPKIEFGATVVNPLNQRGAQGKIDELDLYSQDQVNDVIINGNPYLSGTYIRPFTVEFSVTCKF